MKKIKSLSLLQNVYLLYFLFLTAIIHLGYYLLIRDTQSLVLFALSVVFVYLIHKNMIVVLGISLLFVDALYMIQGMTEGYKNRDDDEYDEDDYDDCSDCSGNLKEGFTFEGLGNPMKDSKIMGKFPNAPSNDTEEPERTSKQKGKRDKGKRDKGKEKEKKDKERREKEKREKDKEKKKGKPKKDGDHFEDAVNPLVDGYETIGREKEEGSSLNDVQIDSAQMNSMLEKLKKNPEVGESLKTLNGIDMHELNRLINSLNTVVDSFSM